jgi:hypothetical protein
MAGRRTVVLRPRRETMLGDAPNVMVATSEGFRALAVEPLYDLHIPGALMSAALSISSMLQESDLVMENCCCLPSQRQLSTFRPRRLGPMPSVLVLEFINSSTSMVVV